MQNCIEFWQDERKNGSFFFIVNKIMFTKRKIWKILKRAPNNRNEKTRQCANILCRLILLWSQSHVKIVFHLLNIFQWKCEQHSELSCDRVCVSAIEYFFYCQCLSLLFCTFALQYFKSIFSFWKFALHCTTTPLSSSRRDVLCICVRVCQFCCCLYVGLVLFILFKKKRKINVSCSLAVCKFAWPRHFFILFLLVPLPLLLLYSLCILWAFFI